MKYLPLIGRILFSYIFIMSGFHHFSEASAQYAAKQGVPMPSLLVPISGLLAIVGGLSVLLGFKARIGALLLIIFLVPVTLMMHNYWAVDDPMMKQMQHAMFNKNLSMLGSAILICYFGAGPLSLDSLFQKKPHFYH
jgi:putative oxidoreductase